MKSGCGERECASRGHLAPLISHTGSQAPATPYFHSRYCQLNMSKGIQIGSAVLDGLLAKLGRPRLRRRARLVGPSGVRLVPARARWIEFLHYKERFATKLRSGSAVCRRHCFRRFPPPTPAQRSCSWAPGRCFQAKQCLSYIQGVITSGLGESCRYES